MSVKHGNRTKARPFLKWAGGKTQLLPTINSFLPEGFREEKDVTYIEPFVGGGAMMFFMLQEYPNIKRVIINDINPHLTNAYKVVRDEPYFLTDALSNIQKEFRAAGNSEAQKAFFINIRNRFNKGSLTNIEEAAYMIFLNRTCFNGLYRENLNGKFNVPFGRYSNPTICDESLIFADSEILQKVEILTGDFSQTYKYINGYTFIYFDPPYRPLNATSNFNSYVKGAFSDDEHIRLKDFYMALSRAGNYLLLSNSDSKDVNSELGFFDELYKEFIIERVYAKRTINSKASKRGAISELLIRNYKNISKND